MTTILGWLSPRLQHQQILQPTQRGTALEPSFSARDTVQFGHAASLRFGARGKAANYTGNCVFVTPEYPPIRVGGLGMASKCIPAAVNKYTKMDWRIVVPYLKPMADEEAKIHEQIKWIRDADASYDGQIEEIQKLQKQLFAPTGLTKTLKGPDGKPVTMVLLQKYVEEDKTWVYALKEREPQYFTPHENLYFPPDYQPHFPENAALENALTESLTKDGSEKAIFRGMALFSRAAEAFLPELNASKMQAPGVSLIPFDGKVDGLIINDWLTSFISGNLAGHKTVALGHILHNVFDQTQSLEEARKNHLTIPNFASKEGVYSALHVGLQAADELFADQNYIHTLTENVSATAKGWAGALKRKLDTKHVHQVFHAPDDRFNPINNPALQQNGFTPLAPKRSKKAQRTEIIRFKTENKTALQQKLGLTPDPNAKIYTWLARFDPYQKGFFHVIDTIAGFMGIHPDVQVIIAGAGGTNGAAEEKLMTDFITKMQAEPLWKGRFAAPGKMSLDGVIQTLAGSDFLMHPSRYEPFGLSQLEAMMLGTIPIGRDVDGLKSTILDPDIMEGDAALRPAKKYGQTGFLMRRLGPNGDYHDALTAFVKAKAKATAKPLKQLSPGARNTLFLENSTFGLTLNHTYRVMRHEPERITDVRLNGRRFVTSPERQWDHIAQLYVKTMHRAIQRVQKALQKPGAPKASDTPAA